MAIFIIFSCGKRSAATLLYSGRFMALIFLLPELYINLYNIERVIIL